MIYSWQALTPTEKNNIALLGINLTKIIRKGPDALNIKVIFLEICSQLGEFLVQDSNDFVLFRVAER
jgi:hypothetical protein